MNLMFLLSVCNIFPKDELNNRLNARNVDSVQALNWIRDSTVPPARRNICTLASKSQDRKAPLDNFIIKYQKDVVLNGLDARQASQSFCAALALHTFATRDERIKKAFRITFYDRKFSIIILKGGYYVLCVLGFIAKNANRNPDIILAVFEKLIWFNCVNMS